MISFSHKPWNLPEFTEILQIDQPSRKQSKSIQSNLLPGYKRNYPILNQHEAPHIQSIHMTDIDLTCCGIGNLSDTSWKMLGTV